MTRPLAIDLFCGLFQSKLALRAYSAIEKLVACWAQNPNHMRLSIPCKPPSSISLEFRSVSNFKNSIFTAGFAGVWHIWVSFFQSVESVIGELALRLVGMSPLFVLPPSPDFSQIAGGSCRALCGAISCVGIWRLDRKVRSTTAAVAPFLCRSLVLLASDASSTLRAIIAAPFFIRSSGLKGSGTLSANQIVHLIDISP